MSNQYNNKRSTDGYKKPQATWRNVLNIIVCAGSLIFLWVMIFWLVLAAFGD